MWHSPLCLFVVVVVVHMRGVCVCEKVCARVALTHTHIHTHNKQKQMLACNGRFGRQLPPEQQTFIVLADTVLKQVRGVLYACPLLSAFATFFFCCPCP